ncbi:MYG1 family protein [Luteolibacter yonseiensis]|uniref:MYG1 family protein n=1 Tax=Luteolibacter yonseiensis TaxID=1144680 RepID=A0A934V6X4_9BACT|nr:MYG1 family protein [Luteolibacter yonseiensis]MBK1815512.1 MYG1 family protein [Luteolibacter yonseiensis]
MTFSRILTHPGGSHKDEFLACCLLLAGNPVPVVRREPVAEDLADPSVAVVDVGHEHAPERGNFDHHQFPKDHPPTCALSLVLQHLGVYEDAREFCDWLEPAEWFDTRGPIETAKWLGLPRETLFKLNSPIDTTLLRRFAASSELLPGEPLWEVMKWIGEDLLGYLKNLRERLDHIARVAEFWEIPTPQGSFKVLFMPRTEPMPEEPSSGLPRFIEGHPQGADVVGQVYPDRRGPGYGLSRHNDHPGLDFTRIGNCEDVHFAHARGFVAKTSASDPARLRELLAQAWIS